MKLVRLLVGINYVDFEVDETDYYYGFSVDGWGLSLDSAVNENVLLTVDWFRLDENFRIGIVPIWVETVVWIRSDQV